MQVTDEMVAAATASWYVGDVKDDHEAMRRSLESALRLVRGEGRPLLAPGWRLVPVEPTYLMLGAMAGDKGQRQNPAEYKYLFRHYADMLDAAPTPQDEGKCALAGILAQAERVAEIAIGLRSMHTAPVRYEAEILRRLLDDFEKAREVMG